MYYVYVLQSDFDDGLYIGFSSELKRRLKEHQSGRSMSTRHRGPWVLIYYESYLCEEDALGRERFFEKWSRSSIVAKAVRDTFSDTTGTKGPKTA